MEIPAIEAPSLSHAISTLFSSPSFSHLSGRIVYYPPHTSPSSIRHQPEPKLNLKGWAGDLSLPSLAPSFLLPNALHCSNDEHI